jgi:hypothetical protein
MGFKTHLDIATAVQEAVFSFASREKDSTE